jgi:hypothetical protein
MTVPTFTLLDGKKIPCIAWGNGESRSSSTTSPTRFHRHVLTLETTSLTRYINVL